MRIHWYWPFSHAGDVSPLVATAIRPGDTMTVQALSSRFGQELTSDSPYDVVRDLTEANRARFRASALGRAPGRAAIYLGRARARHRLVSRRRFDVSCQHQLNRYTDAVALPLLPADVARVSFVHDVHPHEPRLGRRVEGALLRRTFRAGGELIVYHRVLADALVADHGIVPDRVHVVRHPLVWTDATERASNGEARFLFFGNLRPNKGLGILLDAVEDLAAGDVDGIRVHIAGRAHGRAAERVQAAAHRHPFVSAEIGFVAPERMAELFGTSTAVLLPYTRFASQSGVLADAYAHRLPLVVSDVGAIGPTVHDDGTGVVVPPGDPGALAAAMRTLAASPDMVRDHRAAIERVGPTYDAGVVGAAVRDVFEIAVSR